MNRFRLMVSSIGLLASGAVAQTVDDRPWAGTNPIIILDPYEANTIDWDKVVTDRNVKAIIHRAGAGSRSDAHYLERGAQAKRRGLLYGLYWMGLPGDPIRQADALIAAGKATDARFLALDIENLDPKRSMTIPKAILFLEHIHQKTGRNAALYVNFSTYRHISAKYAGTPILKASPLWLARFRATHGMADHAIWPSYTIWQFSSELNCSAGRACFYRVPGTRQDMDVNVFQGSDADLRAFFQ